MIHVHTITHGRVPDTHGSAVRGSKQSHLANGAVLERGPTLIGKRMDLHLEVLDSPVRPASVQSEITGLAQTSPGDQRLAERQPRVALAEFLNGWNEIQRDVATSISRSGERGGLLRLQFLANNLHQQVELVSRIGEGMSDSLKRLHQSVSA